MNDGLSDDLDHDLGVDAAVEWLRRLVRGPAVEPKVGAWLAEAVPEEFFSVPDGLTLRQRQALTYERLRHAGRAAPSGAELLEDPASLCALLERAAIADPALFHVMLLHYTLALGPILKLGDPDAGPDAERAELESMAAAGTLLMTEAGRSNSHLSPRTLARYDAETGGFVLTSPDAAAAKFPTNTAHPDVPKIAAVYATVETGGVERGVFVFVVRLRAADGSVPDGVRIVAAPDSTGLPVDYAAVRLEGLRVPRSAWLSDGARIDEAGVLHDPVGGGAARLTRSMGIAPPVWRAAVSASAAVTRASAGLLWAHSAGRATLGRLAPRRPLTDYRNQQEAVLGALASAYALTLVASHVKGHPAGAAPGAAGEGSGEQTAWAPWSAVDRDLALLKAAATFQAQETVARCRVHSGAPGFAATDRLNAYRGLAHAYLSAGGDNALVLFDTARAMADLDHYRMPERSQVDPEADLGDPEVWLGLAGAVERRLRERLADRVSGALAQGAEAFTAWNDNLALATATATALGDRLVLEVLAGAVRSGPPVLKPLLGLHALEWMERRAGTLVDERVVAPGLLERVWRERRGACDLLAPHAERLAAALDLPGALGAPAQWVVSGRD